MRVLNHLKELGGQSGEHRRDSPHATNNDVSGNFNFFSLSLHTYISCPTTTKLLALFKVYMAQLCVRGCCLEGLLTRRRRCINDHFYTQFAPPLVKVRATGPSHTNQIPIKICYVVHDDLYRLFFLGRILSSLYLTNRLLTACFLFTLYFVLANFDVLALRLLMYQITNLTPSI